MILLLGDVHDPVCAAVQELLDARAARVCLMPILFGGPNRFCWSFDTVASDWQLELPSGDILRERDLEGVLVRRAPWIGSDGWHADDLSYSHAEASAAALGWLWSLRCPIVGRLPSSIWYRSGSNLLDWRRWLREAGLPIQTSLITNVMEDAREFSEGAAVFHLMGPDASFFVRTEQEWDSLAAFMERTPACLTRPHGEVRIACVVGDEVVWTDGRQRLVDERVLAFARQIDLSFVELAFCGPEGEEIVVAVEPAPRLQRFDSNQLERITAKLCDLLGASQVSAAAGVAT